MTKPRVVVGSLGGTVSMTSESSQQGVLPTLTAQDLVDNIPEIAKVADIHAENILKTPSAHLSFEELLVCLKWAKQQIADGAEGVVLTQGTDTLEETAFLFDLYWDLPQPLVLTGAMRPPQKAGADGPSNLLAAVIVASATNSRQRGVLVVMNDWVHEARWVIKAHTADVAAFQSQVAACGNVFEKKTQFFRSAPTRITLPLPQDISTKVLLWESTLAEYPDVLRWAYEQGYKGIVIAGFGAGHVSQLTAEVIAELANKLPIIVCSRTGQGSTAYATYGFIGSEIDLQKKGVLMGGWLCPRKARLLLWAILASHSPIEMFNKYLATLTD